ncbi:hypothetical protein [Pectobacterium phage CX5]|uniref:Exonuclease n=1 Tax=Pectobacterium phage CX5 TaxID=2652426 RepID=A0A5P8D3P1_9CAUD|nr:hypothetical protein [Pectobacterium phage CX5]QFP93619.1 hypothetical protein [Pectobacterium phage CX5-1]
MSLPDFSDLPMQFPPPVEGRILLLDSDFMCYQAAATVKNIDTAVRRFQTLVETQRFLVNAETVHVHITESGCQKLRRFDYPTIKPYQGNRDDKAKPALLDPLRRAVPTTEWDSHWSVYSWRDREADDGLMMDAVLYGDRAIMCSGDKDLNITPGPLWIADEGRIDYIDGRYGWIDLKRRAKDNKVVGHGTKFFWAQMLMGDSADHVQGITRLYGKLCGAVGAYEALEGITNESDAAEFVIRAYVAANQNPLAEAECLWLRRSLDDSAFAYISELGLPDNLQQWLNQLDQYHKEVLELKLKEREQHDQDEQTSTQSSPRVEVLRSASGDNGCDVPWEGGCVTNCAGCARPA